MNEELRQQLEDSEALLADGFNEAVIGIDDKGRAVYDADKMIDILTDQGMDRFDAIEHFGFNIAGSHMGDMTPIYVWLAHD